MKFVRYQHKGQAPTYGWLHENMVGPIEGSIYGVYRRLEAILPVDQVRLLSPVEPSKIICIGRNYAEHAKEHGAAVPEIPLIFLKPPSAIISPGDTILLPPQSKQVEHEVELGVVIGRRGRWISPAQANNHVLGYTVAIDVTARDLQMKDGQWIRGKGFDTFCPFGPWVDTDFDPADAVITCHVNGTMRQMASTQDMIFKVNQLIAFISSVMTLEPGDLILTGTPSGVSPLVAGDVVEAKIEGLGSIRNPVALEPHEYA